MNLGIVCGCEGLLSAGAIVTVCTRCQKSYPTKDLQVILKLLRVADYEPSSVDQKPPTDDEKHNALTLATRRLIALRLKVMDIDNLWPPQPVPPPRPDPPPVYSGGFWAGTTTASVNYNSPFVNVYVRIRVE
jgi:hypothetical protein